MTVSVGLTLPVFVEDPEVPLAVARAADDALGIDGVFALDHLFRESPAGRRPALECFTLLGAVAAETKRCAIGTLVARATLRPSATLAHCFETVRRVSGGRVIAAIGAGDRESRAENEEFGLGFGTIETRVAALGAAIEACRGRGFPVWVGGTARPVLDLVPRADGWNGWGLPVDAFASLAASVRAIAPAAALTWGGLVLLGASEAEAQAKAARFEPGPHVLVGGPDRVAEGLRAYVDAGASWLVLGPVDSSNAENAALVAERVVPLLR